MTPMQRLRSEGKEAMSWNKPPNDVRIHGDHDPMGHRHMRHSPRAAAAMTPQLARILSDLEIEAVDTRVRRAPGQTCATATMDRLLADVQRFVVNESTWPRWAGSAPGSRSCRCPPGIMAEEGICPNTGLRITDSWWFAEEDTPELRANLSFAADHNLRIRVYDFTKEGVTKRNGAFFMKRIPPGYDEATGEKLPPSAEDAA